MDEEIERLVIGVRADTAAFARDVAAMRGNLDGPLATSAGRAGTAIEAGLLRAVRSGKLGFEDLKKTALSVLAEIAAAAVKSGLDTILGSVGAASGGGGVLSLLGLPGRATGGSVSPGAAYVVGERGPELFVPTAAGRVAPAASGGGGREVRVAITVNAATGTAPAALAQSSRQVARAVKAALAGGAGLMCYWLAERRTVQKTGVLTRFDPRFWTVDFPRPMMAAVVSTAADALRVDVTFRRRGDLAGLIWAAEDRIDHPLLAYETARDFRSCRLSFRWRSAGVLALDAVNGPTLTIEGRDEAGVARAWYVRLWNYAEGTPEDAAVAIDFAAVDGGFLLPGEADAVWAGDVDRMFVSLVPPGFAAADDTPLDGAGEGWVELTGIACEGPGSVLAIGEAVVPEHGLSIASGYDDSYNLTPARLLRNALQLGYRGDILHYVGMSHYPRLELNSGGFYASLAGGALCGPCAAWHRDFAARAKTLGFGIIWSVSYELLDQHCWGDWKQRAADGSPAQTGWVPPSTLLSPAHGGAMDYLKAVAAAFVGIAVEAGLAVQFQVGEPWWWVLPDGRPCLYDANAVAAIDPAAVPTVRASLTDAQKATLDRAGALLAASTAALAGSVKAIAPGAVTHLLTYLPTVLDPAAPELKRANLPVGWASPAFDVLQLEDYDWCAAGNTGATRASNRSGGGAAQLSGGAAALPGRLRAHARGCRAVAGDR